MNFRTLLICVFAVSLWHSVSSEEVPLVPCGAVNDTTCVYKSDLVEGILSAPGDSTLYWLDLSNLEVNGTDGMTIQVRSISSGDAESAASSISVYVRKDTIPTSSGDYDTSYNITCLTSTCDDMGPVGICGADKTLWYVLIVNSGATPVSFGVKFGIVDMYTSPVVFDCDEGEMIPALLFYLLTTFTTLICCLLCASFCLCCCGGKKRKCEKKCHSCPASQVSVSINGEEQAPLLYETTTPPPPYPGPNRSAQVTPPFYYAVNVAGPNQPPQYQYVMYPSFPQAPQQQ
jgi:hypothetical protein